MSSGFEDFNARIIDEFRSNEGRVGAPFESMPLLLLHHTGARSGKDYVTPLVYRMDKGRYVIFASKGGAPTNPAWYHNLIAGPDVSIEVGTETLAARAQELQGEERDRIYEEHSAMVPQFAEYATKAGERTIPVIALVPQGS